MTSLREQDKHFLSSLYIAIAIIFTWKGLWEGLYEIPLLGDPFVALFFGFALLIFSGLIFREFDPLGGLEKGSTKAINEILQHPERAKFAVHYKDKALKQEVEIPASMIKKIDQNTLVVEDPKQKTEFFIPLHRVTEIRYNGQRYWRF